MINNVVYFPFRGNITIVPSPAYIRYKACIDSPPESIILQFQNKFAIARECRRQALNPTKTTVPASKPTTRRPWWWPVITRHPFCKDCAQELTPIFTKVPPQDMRQTFPCNLPSELQWLNKLR